MLISLWLLFAVVLWLKKTFPLPKNLKKHFQGFIIFVLYCYRREDVRNLWLGKYLSEKLSSKKKNIVYSNSGASKSMTTETKKQTVV